MSLRDSLKYDNNVDECKPREKRLEKTRCSTSFMGGQEICIEKGNKAFTYSTKGADFGAYADAPLVA